MLVLELLELVLVDVVLVVVVVDEDEDEDAGLGEEQDSDAPSIGSVIGRCSAETGVPGAAFTLNVRIWPETSLTVTTHWSADAFGIAATPIVTAAALAAAKATLSFLLLNTVV